jgi:putative component of membrane protein insertase Oxa1/YidC/SpoIIIJ protein YidD
MLSKCFLFLLLFISLEAMPGYNLPWGKDTDLHLPAQQEEVHLSLLGKAMGKIIWFHQNVISPVDGPRSHFRPSSSNYMMQAIQKHGFFKGYAMGCDRLLRENSETWVYRTALIDGKIWKVDPP